MWILCLFECYLSKYDKIWNMDWIDIRNINPWPEQYLAIKLSEFPPMTLDHLGKRIKKIGTSYPWSIPQCYIGKFGIMCLSQLCGLSILLMAYQTTTYTYTSNYAEAQITYEHCSQSHEGYVLPSTVQASQVHAPTGNVLLTVAEPIYQAYPAK